MTAFLYPITVPACRKYMFHMIIMVDGETGTNYLRYCLILILFSTILKIP